MRRVEAEDGSRCITASLSANRLRVRLDGCNIHPIEVIDYLKSMGPSLPCAYTHLSVGVNDVDHKQPKANWEAKGDPRASVAGRPRGPPGPLDFQGQHDTRHGGRELKTGKDASGNISLRSAIQAANSKPNADTIVLPAGTISLTLRRRNEDNSATGDLDVKSNMTIKGNGASSSIIDGNNLDRVFQVLSGKVQISGRDHPTWQGDRRRRPAEFRWQGHADLRGGHKQRGPGNDWRPRLAGRERRCSRARAGGRRDQRRNALGGGISNESGSLTLSKTTLLANQALGGDGGQGGGGGYGQGRVGGGRHGRPFRRGGAGGRAAAQAAPHAAAVCSMRPRQNLYPPAHVLRQPGHGR